MAMNNPINGTFPSFPRPAAEVSVTFTALDDGDEATAGKELEGEDDGWAT
jgi:hypothetical protein